ncbi:hypothetical protein WMF38_21785 [Sorangium sp. So ce118]
MNQGSSSPGSSWSCFALKPVLTVDDMSALNQAVVAAFGAVETKLTSLLPVLAGGGAAGGAALSSAAPGLLARASIKKTMAK